jgi:hypothetical protein
MIFPGDFSPFLFHAFISSFWACDVDDFVGQKSLFLDNRNLITRGANNLIEKRGKWGSV